MAAGLAHADGLILYLVLGYALGTTDILFLSADVQQYPGEEQEDPQKQVDDPPPPAEHQPPQATVALLPVLGLCLGDGFRLLLNLEVDVIASALGATDVCHRFFLHICF